MTANPALSLLRAEAHVSVSSVGCYLRCPEQYRHRYLNRTPPSHKSSALAFGSAIHAALAHFYRELMYSCSEPSAEELAATFSDAWTRELGSPLPVLFDKNDGPDALRDKGVALVRLFHVDAPRPHRVMEVEEPFSVEVHDPTTGEVFDERLVGAVDAIVQDDLGQYHLLEHKTGARKRSFQHDLQGAIYSYVAPRIGLGDKVAATYQLLTKTKTPTLHVEAVSFTDADRHDALRTVAGVLAAVRAGAFFPRRDQVWLCRGCPYAAACIAG
jgi:putative RecB family exonuclease